MRPTLDLGRRVNELRQHLIQSATGDANPSCERIAQRGLLPVGASTMWRALAIYHLAHRYPELFQYRHLGVAHLALLLKLRGPLQLALLRRAERRRWSRSQLKNRILGITQQQEHGVNPLDQFAEELASDDVAPFVRDTDRPGDDS